MMYRARDVLVASVGLLLLSPLFLLIALVVTFDSRGPVFFRQTRVGQHGKPFRIHKFRTMKTGLVGPAVSTTRDPRITRAGRFLRLAKLDELPQLLDVLRGTMSLVGPRPEVPEYVALWPDDLRDIILEIRPGITDPVTLRLRNEADILEHSADPERTYVEELLPAKAEAYARYAESRSSVGDLWVIFRTLAVVIAPRVFDYPSPQAHADRQGQPLSAG